jgi:Lrp/AsnC family transcriptional regulator for asnA, asnC and gidA
MDETDIAISLMLLTNSRTPLRAIAGRLGLSVNAVNKRIQAMVEAGIIRGFTARPSAIVTGALNVYIYGSAMAEPLRDLPSKLSRNESVYWVTQAGGGYIYVGAHVRGLGELSAVSDYVRKTAEMPSPTVGIIDYGGEIKTPPEEVLDALDWQIIHSLSEDSRKPVAEVAKDLDASAKTVRRRLDRMIEGNLIELSIKWYPDVSDDIMGIFHAKLAMNERVDPAELQRKYAPHLLYQLHFSNIPDEHLMFTWTRTMKELKLLKENIEKEPCFRTVAVNILYTGEIFPTWRDSLPLRMGWPENPRVRL